MKNLYWCIVVILLVPFFGYAQRINTDLSAIEATAPLSADQLPPFGTFYSAANPQNPPVPGNIFGWSGWLLTNGSYLLDDLDVSSRGGSQAGPMMMTATDGISPPGGGGSGGYEFTNSVAPFVFPTNGLWLWITIFQV